MTLLRPANNRAPTILNESTPITRTIWSLQRAFGLETQAFIQSVRVGWFYSKTHTQPHTCTLSIQNSSYSLALVGTQVSLSKQNTFNVSTLKINMVDVASMSCCRMFSTLIPLDIWTRVFWLINIPRIGHLIMISYTCSLRFPHSAYKMRVLYCLTG